MPTTEYVHATRPSPLGAITVVMAPTGLHRVFFADSQPQHANNCGSFDDTACEATHQQLAEYFEGKRTKFDVTLAADGTEFQRRVWGSLADIPFGEARSYSNIATALGKPSASRAVGAANGKNPIAIIVPCHRVVGASGALTGYNGGIDRKKWLLRHEGLLPKGSDALDDRARGLSATTTHGDQPQLSIPTL